ncbi:uncharacterized protein [Drosophila pseudoobscura]|uniref:Uncharacterized protein isoform X1 n=1 Tax=Drosophila pseudoobscura pseudoobscura TaxID=46245 RepID=A0A6I8V259_DROPS|nr:uncharacterized protein LOC6896898 isoform X1 [Drosophila pseudoobscura]
MTPTPKPASKVAPSTTCEDVSLVILKRTKSLKLTRDKKQGFLRHLRKSMKPKNALIVLNELKDKGIKISDFTINSNPDGSYTAIVTVNSNQYQKTAVSKMAAKKLACESALRDYAIAKMKARPRKPKTKDEENQPSTNHVAESMDIDGSDTDNDDDAKIKARPRKPKTNGGENQPSTNHVEETTENEDDTLELNLAPYAMYKLLKKWKRKGYFKPEKYSLAKAQPQQEDAGRGRAELPPNWQTMHPASLLHIMRPGIKYMYYDKDVELQRSGVIVDNQKITAYGCSKKVARRNVAVNACNILFGTNFTPGE